LGSHQAETLREVAQEAAEENLRSPRVSWTNGEDGVGDLQQYAEDLTAGVTNSLNAQNGQSVRKMQEQDALAVAQNGGMQDDSDLDVDADDGMDDDMTGGISSSPSIEDGGSDPALISRPSCWPRRVSSIPRYLRNGSHTPSSSSSSTSSQESSTFTAPGARTPTPPSPHNNNPSPHSTEEQQSGGKDITPAATVHHHLRHHDNAPAENEPADVDSDAERVESPENSEEEHIWGQESGPGGFKATIRIGTRPVAEWEKPVEDEEEREDMDEFHRKRRELEKDESEVMSNIDDDDDDDLFIPYEAGPEDDDGSEISFPYDEMYIGSGWGHECLRDTEDIDFEFVYALHTFVATVEGQANATKGDTMVLLDDSNSYWWLVRVVKDSSIGMVRLGGSVCWTSFDKTRVLAGRTYRDANRKISAVKQAPEYRCRTSPGRHNLVLTNAL
jgi:hypothetical protein